MRKFIALYRTDRIVILTLKILVYDLEYEESYFIFFGITGYLLNTHKQVLLLFFKATESKFKLK